MNFKNRTYHIYDNYHTEFFSVLQVGKIANIFPKKEIFEKCTFIRVQILEIVLLSVVIELISIECVLVFSVIIDQLFHF